MRVPGLLPVPRRLRAAGGAIRLGPGAEVCFPSRGPDWIARSAFFLHREMEGKFGLSLSVLPGVPEGKGRPRIELAEAGAEGDSDGVAGEAYSISCTREAVRLSSPTGRGMRNAVWTLLQLCEKSGEGVALPRVEVRDRPALALRGVMEDVSRGKVPRLGTLKELVSQLAEWKINAFQLYVEHTFRFRKHPAIGRGWSPLSAADIRGLDTHCREKGVELIPSLASFAHMEHILELPRYRRLGAGEPADMIMPLRPATYRFLDQMFSEYLPCFSSRWFNVNCDETRLGKGRTASLVRRLGAGEVYLRHILELHRLVTGKHGRRMMMWGDIIGHHPELIPRLPRDIVLLPWGYFHRWNPAGLSRFALSRREFIVCPGTGAWHSPSPWVGASSINVTSAARSAAAMGARGLMITDWGDGGHQQPLGLSMYGFGLAAAQAWSGGRTGLAEFERGWCRRVFGEDRRDGARLMRTLGEANEATGITPVYWHWYYSINFILFFHRNGDFAGLFKRVSRAGVRALASLASRARRLLGGLARRGAGEPLLRRELGYSVAMLEHLASRLGLMLDMGRGLKGRAVAARGRKLLESLRRVRGEFAAVWTARNRPRRREITLRLYDRAAAHCRRLLREAR